MGGGGAKSRLCAAHYPLNPKLSLYTLLFTFLTFLYFKFLVVASECIAQARQSIKSKMLCQIDCHAKNRLCSFLLAMTADFVILSLLQKGEKSKGLKAHLLFLDTSLPLSMTNLSFCLRITDIFTQILKHKFKFFTQNSKHFTNSTHFINLSQISSLMQGFFIFLTQIFAQFLLINSAQGAKNG